MTADETLRLKIAVTARKKFREALADGRIEELADWSHEFIVTHDEVRRFMRLTVPQTNALIDTFEKDWANGLV